MIIRIVVVLPAPLPPTKPVSSPDATVNETSSTALICPNDRVRPRTSTPLVGACCGCAVLVP